MKRINLIKNQLKKSDPRIISSAWDYFDYDEVLTEEEKQYRKRLRQFLKEEVEVQINAFIEKETFPLELVKKLLRKFPGLLGFTINGYNSAGLSKWLTWSVLVELARCDLSLATFCLMDGGELIMKTIHQLGNEEQRRKYLPKMNSLDIIGSFCMSEPEYGSDASSIESSVKESEDGSMILNGKKRWVGNASIASLFIVFARNEKNEVGAYIVEKENSPGITITNINNKMSTRGLLVCDVNFDNVKILKENRLEKATNFHKSGSQMLLGSRLGTAWLTVGACIGAYDRVIEYCSNRKQFGRTLTNFQLIQDKITRIMSNTQAMMAFCKRASELYIKGKLSLGRVGLLKAWCTNRARETLAIARELMGGNGILMENWVIKTMLDLESCHTYEGTSDINFLVSGKELTGIAAFISK